MIFFGKPLHTFPDHASNPDFSRHLIECCGKLISPIPQPAPVIWAQLLARCSGLAGVVEGIMRLGFSSVGRGFREPRCRARPMRLERHRCRETPMPSRT